MTTLNDRHQYWLHINKDDIGAAENVMLADDGNGLYVPGGQLFTLAELNEIPEADVVTWKVEQLFVSAMAAIDEELTFRMKEDIWMVASGQITYADLKADYKVATGKDVLPIDEWVAKKQAKREP